MHDGPSKPWKAGGAETDAEARAARLLRSAQTLEQAELDQVSPGHLSARLAQRLSEGEWPSQRRSAWTWWVGLATAASLVGLVVVVRTRQTVGGVVVAGEARSGARALHPGDAFGPGQELTAQGEVALRLDNRAEVTLTDGAQAQLDTQGQLALSLGTAQLEVEPRRSGEPKFMVRADDVTVTVVGTRFSVTRSPKEGVTVAVTHGKVRVDSPAGTTFVEPSSEPWRSKPDPLFDVAARHAQAGQLNEARALYVQLAQKDTPSAETALYLHARLEAREFHDLARALELLDVMAQRFPEGTLRRERLQSQLEALVALERCEPARAVWSEFNRLYPQDAQGVSLGPTCQP